VEVGSSGYALCGELVDHADIGGLHLADVP
jgi:hypothetical protein